MKFILKGASAEIIYFLGRGNRKFNKNFKMRGSFTVVLRYYLLKIIPIKLSFYS
jgi:hypothetical protein